MNNTQGPTFPGLIHAEPLRWRARRPHKQHHLRTTHLESGDASTAGVAAPKPKSPSIGAHVPQIETLQPISQPAAPLGATTALNSYAQIALLDPQFTHGDIAATPLLQPAAPLGAAVPQMNPYAKIALLNPQFTHGDIAATPLLQPAAPLGAAVPQNPYAQIALLNPKFTHGDIAATPLLQPALLMPHLL